jgi:hypothetical protein
MDMIYPHNGRMYIAALPADDLPETRQIHALVRFQSGGRSFSHRYTVVVPHDTSHHQSVKALVTAAARIMEMNGGTIGYVRHHRWHSLQPLRLRHWLHAVWHGLTCIMKPFSSDIAAVRVGR